MYIKVLFSSPFEECGNMHSILVSWIIYKILYYYFWLKNCFVITCILTLYVFFLWTELLKGKLIHGYNIKLLFNSTERRTSLRTALLLWRGLWLLRRVQTCSRRISLWGWLCKSLNRQLMMDGVGLVSSS